MLTSLAEFFDTEYFFPNGSCHSEIGNYMRLGMKSLRIMRFQILLELLFLLFQVTTDIFLCHQGSKIFR